MAKLVSAVYGDALFDLVREQNTVDTVYEETEAVLKVFSENADLTDFLNHPKIDKEEKLQVIKNTFSKFVSDDTTGFLVTIINKERTKDIPDILKYFIAKVMEYKKIGVATVTTPSEMSEDMKAKVVSKLLQVTDYKEFRMNYIVEPEIIGGIVIRIGDTVVDSSIRSKLNSLSRALYKTDVM